MYRPRLAMHTVVAATLLLGACTDKNPASDVRGNYALVWDNLLELTLKIGGAVYRATATSETSTVTFNGASAGGQPVRLDLNAFCSQTEVLCPSETLWAKVAIDQPNLAAQVPNSHVINVVDDTLHELPAGQQAEVRSGLVNQRDEFGLVLGAGARGGGQQGVGGCALLALSTAGGRFSHQGETIEQPAPVEDGGIALDGRVTVPVVSWPAGAPVDGIKDGKLRLGFLGGCAFGPILVGATLEIVTGFSGTRTGAFDPPPFTPLAPEDVPPGIVDGGGFDFGQLDSRVSG